MHGITRDWLYKYWSHLGFFAAIFITLYSFTVNTY
jgi:hypothetical protein